MLKAIPGVEFRGATEDDVHAIADAHRDSILGLGSAHYAPATVNEWANVVGPELYLQAMSRGEAFFIATATGPERAVVLGFSSDYAIGCGRHGTSVYVRQRAARQGIGSHLLALAESFGKSRGACTVEIEASLGAVAFYEIHGFVETARGDVALPSGFRMPCVFMRKEL